MRHNQVNRLLSLPGIIFLGACIRIGEYGISHWFGDKDGMITHVGLSFMLSLAYCILISCFFATLFARFFSPKLMYTWSGIACVVFILSSRNNALQFHLPTLDELLISAIVLGLLCVISGIIVFKGVKCLVFLAIPYLLVFIFLEIGIRIWMMYFAPRTERVQYVDQFRSPANLGLETVYVPHHYTLYNLRPFFSTTEGTTHNRLGIRDHRDLYPEEHVMRIVFMGGSTTYTQGIKDNTKIFSYGLEQRLNEYYQDQLNGYQIQVINAGMGGATSAENLLRLIFVVSEISPDVIVIQHGLNDVWTRDRGTIQSDFSNYRKSWSYPERQKEQVSQFTEDRSILSATTITMSTRSLFLTFIMRRMGVALPHGSALDEDGNDGHVFTIGQLVRRSDIEPSIESLERNGTQYFERNTRYMIAICRVIGAQVILASEVYTEKVKEARKIAMPQHNALLAKIAQEEHVSFYDFFTDMIKDDAYLPDGLHVNQLGSDMKRDLFFDYLVREDIIPALLKKKTTREAF